MVVDTGDSGRTTGPVGAHDARPSRVVELTEVDGGSPRVAVVIPCHNEERSIETVIRDFEIALPGAEVVICDNESTDATAAIARATGSRVLREARRGKGHAVRRLLADVEAEVFVLADGDGEHDAASAAAMVDLLLAESLDMVVGARQAAPDDPNAYRRGHATGNALLTRLFRICVGGAFTDVLSGYRVMSRRFVKSFPVRSAGFDIEADLTAHAIELNANTLEVTTPYHSRSDGSKSKVRTYRDGLRILFTLLRLVEAMYPAYFFLFCAVVLTSAAVVLFVLGVPTHSSPLSSAAGVVAAGLEILAFLALATGIVLKSVKNARQEARRLAYLQDPPPRRR